GLSWRALGPRRGRRVWSRQPLSAHRRRHHPSAAAVKPIRVRYVAGGVAVGIVLLAAMVVALIDPSRFSGGEVSPALRVAVVLLFAFLILLIARYVLLLRLRFPPLVESRMAGSPGDGPEPPVTIIVPAYNEEAVIVPAIESGLRLEYDA